MSDNRPDINDVLRQVMQQLNEVTARHATDTTFPDPPRGLLCVFAQSPFGQLVSTVNHSIGTVRNAIRPDVNGRPDVNTDTFSRCLMACIGSNPGSYRDATDLTDEKTGQKYVAKEVLVTIHGYTFRLVALEATASDLLVPYFLEMSGNLSRLLRRLIGALRPTTPAHAAA